MAESGKPIVVIGSINMDLVCRVAAMPEPGQTSLGSGFCRIPGGKGANQAVAAVRLARSAKVHLIGRVGDDDFGRWLVHGLKENRVGTRHVAIAEGVSSGVAMILVDKRGENSIVVCPGANHCLLPAHIDAAEDLIRAAAVVVLQLETPLATVRHANRLCKRWGVFTILDPAPVPTQGLPREFYEADLFTPNESEAALLLGARSGRPAKARRAIAAKQIAADLLAKGPKSVVLKLGAKGALAIDRDGACETVKAFNVNAIDTTAAGDAFTAALAVAHAEGRTLGESLRFANAAGALCCTRFGAQPALPMRRAVDRLLSQRE